MRDSVPNARYLLLIQFVLEGARSLLPEVRGYVLRQWKTSLIPTYRVYRFYDSYYSHLHVNPIHFLADSAMG